MKVPIVQLELPEIVLEEVKAVLKSGMWAEGKPVRDLEQEFAGFTGAKFCRAVNNGTSALLASIYGAELKPEDEVIIPSFSFIATANCLIPFGIRPVFADIDLSTFTLSPQSIKYAISPKTKALMPVHLYGLCANMDEIQEIADENDLIVIEDACQSHGAEIHGKKAGNLGEIAAFSLYPTKNMFSGGEGGLITTNNEELYEKINRFVNHGQTEKYIHTELGFNFRMPAVAGVIARHSLSELPNNNKKRIHNAELYNELLEKIPEVKIPEVPKGYHHVYHQYTIRVPNRDLLAENLSKNEIGYGIHYKIPIHQQQVYKEIKTISLKHTEKAADEVISLPIHPLLTDEQIQFVASTIEKFYK
ncbi:MAG: DegT/DnrJ/EryC1/StrS family aminotransferase [Candidatus Lokiarchaeota archaeon]|nr:DegT/DnrJ/EryC1/StrS family aminotransferase [Candidatus Lokiarchaeota archaeon]